MKWFNIKGILGEIKKIRWPKRKELINDTLVSVAFIAVFAGFFVLSDFIITFILDLIGVIG